MSAQWLDRPERGAAWARALWRAAVDAAWCGDHAKLLENAPGASSHYPVKTRLQARMENMQGFYATFYKNNPVATNANRFSSMCQNLLADGAVTGCDPAHGREAIQEALTTTIENDRYHQESNGVYALMFLTGNFPNQMAVPP